MPRVLEVGVLRRAQPQWLHMDSRCQPGQDPYETTAELLRKVKTCAIATVDSITLEHQPSSQNYAWTYISVYMLCMQRRRNAETLYEFVKELAEHVAQPPGPLRSLLVRWITIAFGYLDRFYVVTNGLPGVAEAVTSAMENAKGKLAWNRLALKTAFRRWSLDETLLAGAYMPGGRAHKRELDWWMKNA